MYGHWPYPRIAQSEGWGSRVPHKMEWQRAEDKPLRKKTQRVDQRMDWSDLGQKIREVDMVD